jgi:hypothetical protein
MRSLFMPCTDATVIAFASATPAPAQTGPDPTLLWQFAQDCHWTEANGQKPDGEHAGKLLIGGSASALAASYLILDIGLRATEWLSYPLWRANPTHSYIVAPNLADSIAKALNAHSVRGATK